MKFKIRGGMTMIELIIAIVIIGIAFYSLLAVFINLTPRTAFIESIDRKTFLAQEKMEEYLARGFGEITGEAVTAYPGFPNYFYQIISNYVATSDVNTPVAGPTPFRKVKVDVWGGSINFAGTIELVTLVASYE